MLGRGKSVDSRHDSSRHARLTRYSDDVGIVNGAFAAGIFMYVS